MTAKTRSGPVPPFVSLWWFPPNASITNFGERAQFVGSSAAVAEKFQISRDLLEQHVGAERGAAAAAGRLLQQPRHSRPEHDVPDQRVGVEAIKVERQRIADSHAERR